MTQKIIVNGVEYASVDAMPPDVRSQYERALELVKNLGKGIAPSVQDTKVTSVPGGTKVEVRTSNVQYSVDGNVPPELRSLVESALQTAKNLEFKNLPPNTQTKFVVEVGGKARGGRSILLWIILALVAVIVAAIVL